MPATSDFATLLMEVLINDLGLKVGDPVPEQRLKERYAMHGYGPDEVAEGLKQAHAGDWVRWDAAGGGTFFVTEAGFEAGDT